MLKVSPWKGVVRFGKRGKLNPRDAGPFKALARVEALAYSNCLEIAGFTIRFMKCYSDDPLVVPIDGLHIGASSKLWRTCFDELARRGPEFIWEREDRFQKKYPHLFTNRASSSNATSLSLEDKAHLTGGDYNTPCFRVIDVVNKSAMYLLVLYAFV
ncbi:hypothetical protein Tco_0532259 [Tanacetum coccineum]